ncbi:unnamed protein product, partial [marine sediment metagenome]
YVGANGFWNDYSCGPKGFSYIAGIGMNSLIALQKKLLAKFAIELGINNSPYEKQYQRIKEKINLLFWDNHIASYFDYDVPKKSIFTTPNETRFWGLDNLLPLLAGIMSFKRAKLMKRYVLGSDYYGKYPAITTDLSADFQDERRLMVWSMTNWLVVQGLKEYKFNHQAKTIATNIFNALIRNWVRFQGLPEALSGTHNLAPMENPNLAGVGCWASFYLFLKEVYF